MTRVLVVYASKHLGTASIAAAVSQELIDRGLRSTCVDVGAIESLESYDAVVLGSAVYMGRWRHEARRFLRRHSDELAGMPFWIFSSGPVGDPAKDNPAWLEPRRTIAKAVELGVRDHKVFGGVAQGAMAKNMPAEYRDRRDWHEIRAWADGIAAELGAVAQT